MGKSSNWYTGFPGNDTYHTGPKTIPNNMCASFMCMRCAEVKAPWCAPGTAWVNSPCGMTDVGGRGVPPGFDGRDLPRDFPYHPEFKIPAWPAGSIQKVASAISIDHGGGYSCRLCPLNDLTEESCQRNVLEFVCDTQDLVDTSGQVTKTISAKTTTSGTFPKGSMWRKNPQPGTSLNIVDKVKLPATLPPGDYVLSWRWDCELNPQVWANCADVKIMVSAPERSVEDIAAVPPAPAAGTLKLSWKD